MSKRNREQTNQYFRGQRSALRLAKLTRESKALDAQVLFNNPHLIKSVSSWITIAGENCARRELDRLGVSSIDGINRIIEAAKVMASSRLF